jgi:hypothetical protein
MSKKLFTVAFAFTLALVAPAFSEDKDVAPHGRGIGTIDHPGVGSPKGQLGKPGAVTAITYHGGPVMLGIVNVYYIWYGNWDGNSVTLLTNLAQTIGGSQYFNINKTYSSSAGQVSGAVAFRGSTNVSTAKYGTSLSDSAIQSIVTDSLVSALPVDPNGVYFVLTDPTVTASSGFCTKYCGWHTYTTYNSSVKIKYAFVGNPQVKCPSSCSAQSTSPNGNLGADAMASVIAHELEEATTDPELNAWYDKTGAENADKCAWTFGPTSTAANGSQYNVLLGGTNYLIQRNWVNASGGYCAIQ